MDCSNTHVSSQAPLSTRAHFDSRRRNARRDALLISRPPCVSAVVLPRARARRGRGWPAPRATAGRLLFCLLLHGISSSSALQHPPAGRAFSGRLRCHDQRGSGVGLVQRAAHAEGGRHLDLRPRAVLAAARRVPRGAARDRDGARTALRHAGRPDRGRRAVAHAHAAGDGGQ
eukprot:scaffold54682_cov68-Phaeocystis_antarctica.AAC.1